jgi:hypothetical protein
MVKKIYQKNHGRDEERIAEGDLDECDLRQLGSNNKTLRFLLGTSILQT